MLRFGVARSGPQSPFSPPGTTGFREDRMLKNLNIGQKLALVGIVFTAPVGILVFLVASGFQKDIRVTDLERMGNTHLRTLRVLSSAIDEHQSVLWRNRNGWATEPEVGAAATAVDTAFQAAQEVDHRTGADLETTPAGLSRRRRERLSLDRLRADWVQIRQQSGALGIEALTDRHRALAADVRALASHVADLSNLVLDPELDTYYLMDVAVFGLPPAQDRLHEILAYSEPILRRKEIVAEERLELHSFADFLEKVDLARITSSSQAAIAEDPNFHGTSPALKTNVLAALERHTIATQTLRELLMRMAMAPAVDASPEELTQAVKGALDSNAKLRATVADELDKLLEQRRAVLARQRAIGLALCAAALLLWVVPLAVARGIARRITEVIRMLTIATEDADLTKRLPVDSADEVGQLASTFNRFMETLEELIRQVLRSGIQVTTSTTQIASSSKQLEATVAEQVAATNEVVATAREITATSHELASTMLEVARLSEATAASAGVSQRSLTVMESSMEKMEEASQLISQKLSVINEKAENISTVVTTITKVADQTNLLSLNAAIEAEKAGQYGQGFSVVAREIRRLADQTAVATLDIEKMVREMKSAVSAGVMSMDNFGEQVRQAVEVVRAVSGQLSQIIDQVQTVSPQFESVHVGMQAQAQGAQQISESMSQLSETTQQTATGLRETNNSIEQLNEAAQGLQGTFYRFRVGE
jgi:methyl-accepting chemotaxis protein WspA